MTLKQLLNTTAPPMTEPTRWSATLSRDIPASLVTFLVAVPISLGIALASGAPVIAGLISSVIGGLIVGLFTGVPLQVAGPAAGLAVMVFGFIERFGFRTLLAIGVIAGVLQLALGLAKVARVTLAIPPAVIHGMLAGIGVQIFLCQLHVVMGGRPQSTAVANLTELPRQLGTLNPAATALGVATVAILLAWPALDRATRGKLKSLPGPLVAVTVCTVASVMLNPTVARVSVPADWRSAFTTPVWPSLSQLGPVLIAAVSLTIVASAESLLSAIATDKLHDGSRADLDRELVAQGIGNITAGLIGGLPVTGVIVRSTANITSGAKTRVSTMLHGLWVAVFVTQLGFVLAKVPLAVLAGLLCVVGARLVSPAHIRDMAKHRQLSVYLTTLAGVVFVNLLAGIVMGLAVALIRLVYNLVRMKISVDKSPSTEDITVRIAGSPTFLNVPSLVSTLSKLPAGSTVNVEVDLDRLDHACHEAFDTWKSNHQRTGGTVSLNTQRGAVVSLPSRRSPDLPDSPVAA